MRRVQAVVESTYGCSQIQLIRNALMLGEYLVYLNGNQIVKYSTIHGTQRVALKPAEDMAVTAINFFYENRMKICMGVQLESGVTVLKIYTIQNERDLSRFQVFSLPQPRGTVLDIAFYDQANYLVSLFRTDNALYFTLNETSAPNKAPLSIKLSAHVLCLVEIEQLEAYYCYHENTLLRVQISADSGALAEFQPGYKPAFKLNGVIYQPQTSLYIFLGDYEVELATDKVKSFTLRLETVPALAGLKSSTFCKLGKGFAMGFTEGVAVAIFNVEYQKIEFKHLWRLNEDVLNTRRRRVLNMHQSVDNMQIALVAVTELFKGEDEECKLFVPLPANRRIELYSFNVNITEMAGRHKVDPFTSITNKCQHMGEILGMAASLNKKMLFSLGSDRKLVAYTYSPIDAKSLDSTFDRLNFLFSQMLAEVPTCLSLHPTTLILAIGFRQATKLYFVLDSELVQFRKEPRGATALAFSQGGHLLAVGMGGASPCVLVFQVLTMKVVSQWQYTKQITKIIWDGEKLCIICGNKFNLSRYDNQTKLLAYAKREGSRVRRMFWDKAGQYLVLVREDCSLQMLKAGADGFIPQFSHDQRHGMISAIKIFTQANICILGSERGWIRICGWPLTQLDDLVHPYIGVFTSEITCIESSVDNKYVLLGSAEGAVTIFTLRLSGEDEAEQQVFNTSYNNFYLDPVKLVSQGQMQAAKALLTSLAQKRQEVVNDAEELKAQFRLKSQADFDRLNEDNARFQESNLEQIVKVYDSAKRREEGLRGRWRELKEDREKFLRQEEEQFHEKIMDVYRKNETLTQLKERQVAEHHEKELLTRKEFVQLAAILRGEFSKRSNSLACRLAAVKAKFGEEKRRFAGLTEKGAEQGLISAHEEKLHQELEEELKRFAELKVNQVKNLKDKERFEERELFLRTEKKRVQSLVGQLQEKSDEFKEEKQQLEKELLSREKTLYQQEVLVRNMVSKNNHLLKLESVFGSIALVLTSKYRPLMEHAREIDSKMQKLNVEVLQLISTKGRLQDRTRALLAEYKRSQAELERRRLPYIFIRRQTELFVYNVSLMIKEDIGKPEFKALLRKEFDRFFGHQHNVLRKMIRGFVIEDLFEETAIEYREEFDRKLTEHLKAQRAELKKQTLEFQETNHALHEARKKQFYTIQSSNSDLVYERIQLMKRLNQTKKKYEQKTKNLKIFEGRAVNQNKIIQQEKKIRAIQASQRHTNTLVGLFEEDSKPPAMGRTFSSPFIKIVERRKAETKERLERTQAQSRASQSRGSIRSRNSNLLVRQMLLEIELHKEAEEQYE